MKCSQVEIVVSPLSSSCKLALLFQIWHISRKGEKKRKDQSKIIGKKKVSDRNSWGCVRPGSDHWHAWGNSLHSTGQRMVSRHYRARRSAAHMRVLLAFPTLSYSGPLCHYGGFYSATTQIKPRRRKNMRNCSFGREGEEMRCLLVGLFFILFCHGLVFEADL